MAPAPTPRPRYIAVIGGYDAPANALASAEEVGRRLAEAGAVVVTGGREGIAAAACRGAVGAGGVTVGILPGRSRAEANRWVTVAVPTGMGETRNALVVMDADAVIAFPGRFGTLAELAFALHAGKLVIGLGTWSLGDDVGVVPVTSAGEAVDLAMTSVSDTP